MKRKEICLNCGDYVDYILNEEDLEFVFRDVAIKYKEQFAQCKCCGGRVYVAKVEDENLKRIRQGYCIQKGLITQEEIGQILGKYKISLEALAVLVGCGVATIKRYYSGTIANASYSRVLKKLLNNPIEFKNCLEENQSRITAAAFKKAMKAVVKIIAVGFNVNSNILATTNMSTCYNDSYGLTEGEFSSRKEPAFAI